MREIGLEDLGLIGNCQYAALVERSGAVVWCCLPRFDSPPVFSTLLDHSSGGEFVIGAPDPAAVGNAAYLENTNVLATTFESAEGAFRVVDFAPRFRLHDRMFRPTQLVRMVEPISGMPRVRVRCAPRIGWSDQLAPFTLGSHHARFAGFASELRLTTDIPLSHLNGMPFSLTERRHFVLSWGAPVEEPLQPLCDRLLTETVRYWRGWVKQCNIPPEFQAAVIRSALALKLHCFEDTGAIVAATTTSIPEAPNSGRTWDYRYCWLRDAYYALGAFRRLGHFEEREQFLQYLLNVAANTPGLELRPLYRIDGGSDLEERIETAWPGFGGHGPVRVGNAAAKHLQHDIFGEMVLALAPIFLDDRFSAERSAGSLDLLVRLTRRAIAVAGTPDAGIWEYRNAWQPQTFSSLMCWAAADRMTKVARRHAPQLAGEFELAARGIRGQILERGWSAAQGSFVGSYGGEDLDASLLQTATLRLLEPGDSRLRSAIDVMRAGLSRDGWMFRYRADDGLGETTVAFTICTFWLVEALAATGRRTEAKEVMDRVSAALTPLGLMSEDYEVATLRMWGNFPQAYSHVGLIHAAFATSPRWAEVL